MSSLLVVDYHKIIFWIFLFKIINVSALELLDRKNIGPTENQVPDPPENFRVERLTPNSATLRWDPPSSIDNILVRGYTLSYGTGSTDTRKVVLEGAESVEYTLNMLKPNTSYVLSLTAYNEAYGEDSSRLLLLIKTPSTNLKKAKDEVFLLEEENNNNLILPKPKGLKVEKTGNVDEFLLFWDEPKELINENKKNFIYYIVQYWKDSGQKDARKEELHKINVEHPPALLTGIKLINSNKYLAKVKLISSNGSMSQWSEKLPLLRKSEEKNNKNKWISGGIFREMDEAEEDFCGFELPSICDFFREGPWRWERRNSSRDGFSMVIREQIKTLKEFKLKNNELYGRLLSPMFNLKPSETFCVSVQTKLERGGFGAIFRVGIRYESEPKTLWLYRKSLQRFWPQGEWLRLSWQLRRKSNNNRGFQLIFDVSKHTEADQVKFFFSLDNLFVRASDCPIELEPYFGAAPDEETEANLLIPVENLIDTDPRVYRTAGLDVLPAVGIKRGVEIVVPYRIYLPRKFYRNFAVLASIRPSDNLGGFLFAVLNAFDTIVELGVQLQSAGPTQTNISLYYTDSSTDSSEQRSTSRVLASFLVPVFAGQWTQFALEVHEQTVGLYFRCMRYAVRQVYRHPTQLQMDDASKLYIANAGPIIGGGFEGAIQELKLHDDPAEAANQCNENWDAEKSDLISSGFGSPEENELRVDEEEEKFPTPPGSGPAHFLPKNINLLTTTQKEESKTTTLSPTLNTPLIQPQILQQMIPGPKGERGEPGMPGICAATECRMPPPGPPGLQGPPGVFPGLTENDLRRIAAWPGVKGEKGDRGECCDKQQIKQSNTYREGYEDEGEVVLLNGQHKSEQLPAYNKKVHGNDLKGEKGDRGEPGPPGLPGKLIEKSSSSFSGVKIFQTALELLAATHNCAIGSLAFALSTQQLFIRVNAGWKQIILGGTLLTAQSGTKEITAKTSTKQNVDDNVSSPSISINTLPSPEQRWQPRWPPKETRRFEEDEEEEKQKNRVPTVQQKRHKDRIIHLIALNEPLNGNFGGVRGADLECYRQARQSGFSTTFRAFLSSRVQDLNKLVHLDDRHYTPVVNIRGERLFDSWNSVFDGERSVHAHVPIYSFNRKDVTSDSTWPNRWLWHGSTSEGLRTSTAFCDGWRSDNFNSFGNASPLHSRHSLTGQSKEANCNNRFVVLCVEVMSKFNVDSKLGKRFMSDDVIRK